MARLPDRIKQQIEDAATSKAGGRVDRIEERDCSSDEYEGTEYRVYGVHVPVRPILEMFTQEPSFGVESISMNQEWEEPHINLFVADLRSDETEMFV